MATQQATTELTSTMTWDPWAPSPVGRPGDGPTMLTGSVTDHYTGDIEGTGSMQTLIMMLPEGRSAFVGLERIEGRIGGREGGLAVRINGGTRSGHAEAELTVVEGSGTGELAGVTGSGRYVCDNPGPDGHSDVSLTLSFD